MEGFTTVAIVFVLTSVVLMLIGFGTFLALMALMSFLDYLEDRKADGE